MTGVSVISAGSIGSSGTNRPFAVNEQLASVLIHCNHVPRRSHNPLNASFNDFTVLIAEIKANTHTFRIMISDSLHSHNIAIMESRFHRLTRNDRYTYQTNRGTNDYERTHNRVKKVLSIICFGFLGGLPPGVAILGDVPLVLSLKAALLICCFLLSVRACGTFVPSSFSSLYHDAAVPSTYFFRLNSCWVVLAKKKLPTKRRQAWGHHSFLQKRLNDTAEYIAVIVRRKKILQQIARFRRRRIDITDDSS